MKKILSIFLINLLVAGGASYAADEERQREINKSVFMASAAQERVLRIGLIDCIAYALKNNSEIKIKSIDPKLKEDDVRIAGSDFEPTFTADFTVHDNTELSYSRLQGADTYNSQDANLNLGISGKLVTGAEYVFDFINERNKSDSSYQIYNPYYTTEPILTITQPLFRNFGILVNKADILIAKNDKKESQKAFQDTVINSITKAKAAYFDYIFALEQYSLDKLALERIVDLLEVDKARYNKGLISSVALLETEAAVAEKEKALLSAESAVKRAEDQLKLVTNLIDDPEVWDARIEPLDKPIFQPQEVSLLKSLEEAFKFRPDYQSAKINLESREIKIKVAKNALLPTVDLTGSFGLNGIGETYSDAVQKSNFNYQDWSAGIKFSLPWGTGERAKYDQKKLEKAQALLGLKKLEQDIIIEVRDKVREAKVQIRQVEVAKISREKETQNYSAQKERYAAGQVSTHDMLDYQDKLARSELDYVRALIDYNLALINLDKSQGLTLVKNNVKLEG